MIASFIAAGGLTGFLVGLTGIGGGAMMTPLLLLFFKMEPLSAIATDLWFATITKLSAASIHNKNKSVDWRICQYLWLGSLPTAFLTTELTHFLDLSHHQKSFLVPAIAIIIIITALTLFISTLPKKGKSRKPKSFSETTIKYLTITAGCVIGFIVALTSIGAGAIATVFLIFLYKEKLPPSKLIGTDIIHSIPLAFVAGTSYFFQGLVDVKCLLSLLIGSIPATILGSYCAYRFSSKKLKLTLSSVLFLSGIKLLS